MRPLAEQHCANHALREAVARCPECGHFYCRECVTEHEDRVVCASCLRKLVRQSFSRTPSLAWVRRSAQALLGFCLCWVFFYYFGRALLLLPSSFHEGTIWQAWAVEDR